MAKVDIIIPVFNEERSVGKVINDLPHDQVREIVVVNNGSLDATAAAADKAGATVLNEPQKGYGKACLTGIEHLKSKSSPPDILAFLDGDYSDHPEELTEIVKPIEQNEADLVIGSRILGAAEPGAMLPQARFGNWLATTLIRWIYGYKFTDLGPFRAIRWHRLLNLKMADEDFGWTVEMQVKAAKQGIPCKEVPVSYRQRVGISKVTGTFKGTVLAGYKIIYTILKELG